MKRALIILGACLILLCVAGSAGLIGAFHSYRDLRDANRKMETDLRASQTTTDTLLAEKQEMARQLSVLRELTESLQSRIADNETAGVSEAASEGKIPVVSPYQAQAYLGKKSLGWVWIIPQNLRKDTNTQRYVYEPVVWLDEGFRKQFVTHHTNVVEREVESRNYVNTAYYPEPYLYGGYYYPSYPIPRPPASNCPPVWPSHPTRTGPLAPTTPIQPVPQPFNPGSGKVIAQRLGTPAGAIKTRPVP
jgi:hypothetical protein